jgi:hypothetical protein
MPSRNSSEVEVSNVPSGGDSCKKLEHITKAKTEGVVSMRWTKQNTKLIIEYETHRAAAIARRFLISIVPEMYGREDVRVQLLQRAVQVHIYFLLLARVYMNNELLHIALIYYVYLFSNMTHCPLYCSMCVLIA